MHGVIKILDKLTRILYAEKMKAMAVGELKARFSQVLEEVKNGEKVGVLYGKSKKPVAMIIPIENSEPRKIGPLDGIATFKVVGDGKITEEEFLGL